MFFTDTVLGAGGSKQFRSWEEVENLNVFDNHMASLTSKQEAGEQQSIYLLFPIINSVNIITIK